MESISLNLKYCLRLLFEYERKSVVIIEKRLAWNIEKEFAVPERVKLLKMDFKFSISFY